MKIYDKYKKEIENPDKDSIEVTPEDFQEILSDPATLCGPLKPKPPIKSQKREVAYEKVKSGLFTYTTKVMHESEFIEYDYQDPEYLKAMDHWRSSTKETSKIYFYGKKVILKDDSAVTL